MIYQNIKAHLKSGLFVFEEYSGYFRGIELRRLSRDGQIEGWSTIYQDPDEGKDGWRHRDYRRLNTNLYKKNDDGHYQAHHYYEKEGADELTITEWRNSPMWKTRPFELKNDD